MILKIRVFRISLVPFDFKALTMALSSIPDTLEADEQHISVKSDLITTEEPLRVLICEDDLLTLRILEKGASKAGYIVKTAANGQDGLELIEEFQPQLVLSDWMMPRMDGLQLLENICQLPNGSSIYFILLTSKDGNEDKISALDAGADEYLVKPFDGRALMARLRAAERLIQTQWELARSLDELSKANKRIGEEMNEVSKIQISMLPETLIEVEGYDFASLYHPSTECSGDFYDIIELPDDRLGIFVGDVSGHGAPAMVAMTLVNTFLHQFISMEHTPAELLFRVNNEMFKHLKTEQYCTLLYGVLDRKTGDFVYCSGGHPAPLLQDRSNGTNLFLPDCSGFPIKLFGPDMEYEDHEINIGPGNSLVVYTDGLVEAINPTGEIFGDEGLAGAVRDITSPTAQRIIDSILNSLNSFRLDCPMEDDLSLLVISRN
jgi:sigma-B regulation protein RsbU (phosphoserine phosphatase)